MMIDEVIPVATTRDFKAACARKGSVTAVITNPILLNEPIIVKAKRLVVFGMGARAIIEWEQPPEKPWPPDRIAKNGLEVQSACSMLFFRVHFSNFSWHGAMIKSNSSGDDVTLKLFDVQVSGIGLDRLAAYRTPPQTADDVYMTQVINGRFKQVTVANSQFYTTPKSHCWEHIVYVTVSDKLMVYNCHFAQTGSIVQVQGNCYFVGNIIKEVAESTVVHSGRRAPVRLLTLTDGMHVVCHNSFILHDRVACIYAFRDRSSLLTYQNNFCVPKTMMNSVAVSEIGFKQYGLAEFKEQGMEIDSFIRH